MYICVCKAITERQLATAIDNGARTMKELRQQFDLCSCCGKCGPGVRCLLSERTCTAQEHTFPTIAVDEPVSA